MAKPGKKKISKESKPLEMYFLLFSCIILLPFVYSDKVLDNALTPRLFGLGILVFILILFNLFKRANKLPDYNFLRLFIFPVFIIYALLSVVSMTWALNPSEGLFDITKTFLVLFLFIISATVFIENKNSTLLFVKFVIVSSVIAILVGLYQYIQNVPGSKEDLFKVLYEVKGLMAHKNQYVVSIYLMLPFVLYGIYKFSGWMKILSIASSVLIILNIVLLQTRSVWVASVIFFSGYAVLWLFLKFSGKIPSGGKIQKYILVGAAVFVVGLSVSILLFKDSRSVKLMEKKVSSLFDSESSDNVGRLNAWKSTLDLSKEHLLLGVGAGNWRIEILPYSNLHTGAGYQNWQRPHNDFLWVLSEKGIPGLILYLLLFFLTFFYGIKILVKEKEIDKLILTSLLISSIAGYIIIANVTFPLERINHQVYLTLMMAAVVGLYYKSPESRKPVNGYIFKAGFLVLAGITLFSVFYAYKRIDSEINVQYLLASQKRNNWNDMNAYADKAYSDLIKIDPMSNSMYFYKAYANRKLGNNEQAIEYYNIATKHFPTHADTYSNLGNLYNDMGKSDLADENYRKSLAIYPHDANTLFNYAIFQYNQKDYTKAYIAMLNCTPNHKRETFSNLMKDVRMLVNRGL